MTKQEAEKTKVQYINLKSKVLTHKKDKSKIQIIDIGYGETMPKSEDYYVYCSVRGRDGESNMTIETVLKDYTAKP